MAQDRGLPPLRRTLELAVPPAVAFRIWTEELGRWWPLASHSVGQADAQGCMLEGKVGGRIFESTRAGAQHLWGTVVAFEPPARLAHSWHPGRAATEATMIELTFEPRGSGGTRLVLVHDGWQAGSAARRAGYDRGWDALLRDDYGAWVETAVMGQRASS
jgi:uncharacterized protein YndB with AHSA1/START domain